MRVITIIPNLNPIEPVACGDTYEFLDNMITRAGHVHPKGSLLYVHDFTLKTPHDEISESGRNWICRTDFGISIWATLEQCISRRLLKKV